MSLASIFRFVLPLAVLSGLTVNFSSGQSVAPIGGADGAIEYRLIATSKTSTMLKELNEAAAEGFDFVAMMGGETLVGDEVVTVLAKARSAPNRQRHEYKLLATSKTSTMQKELTEAGARGFRYCGQSVAETAFGGQEVVAILKRDLQAPAKRYIYKLLATKRTKTMGKELNQAGSEGFQLVGLTVSETTFGGQELVSILMLAD